MSKINLLYATYILSSRVYFSLTLVFRESIAILPVTNITAGFFPSFIKFAFDTSVGAKQYLASMPAD